MAQMRLPGYLRAMLCACGCGRNTVRETAQYLRGHHFRQPIAVRFWKYVIRRGNDECWEWTGTRNQDGYGRIKRDGFKRLDSAHRVSWMLAYGPIPAGGCILHRCDNPPCVNPAHLFLGDQKINAADKYAKGRDGMQAMMLSKTKCRNGHSLDAENTYWHHGHRQCRTCRRDAVRRSLSRTPVEVKVARAKRSAEQRRQRLAKERGLTEWVDGRTQRKAIGARTPSPSAGLSPAR